MDHRRSWDREAGGRRAIELDRGHVDKVSALNHNLGADRTAARQQASDRWNWRWQLLLDHKLRRVAALLRAVAHFVGRVGQHTEDNRPVAYNCRRDIKLDLGVLGHGAGRTEWRAGDRWSVVPAQPRLRPGSDSSRIVVRRR